MSYGFHEQVRGFYLFPHYLASIIIDLFLVSSSQLLTMIFSVHGRRSENVYGFKLYGGYDFNRIRYNVEAYTYGVLSYSANLYIFVLLIYLVSMFINMITILLSI